jgi:hypothetical protein
VTARLLAAVILPLALPAQDAGSIIRRAIEFDERNDRVALTYTYLQREETRTLDGGGRPKSHMVKTWDITPIEGLPYRRLVERNDQPIDAAEARAEADKLRRSIEERRKEPPGQTARRIAEWRRKREQQRAFINEIPDAYDFHAVGEERVNGLEAWVIDATPRAGYNARSSMAGILPKIKPRFWIGKASGQWMRIEAETMDTISIGWLVVRVGKGSRLTMEQTPVNGEVWLPKHVSAAANVRVLLVKGYHFQADYSFSGYKKFQADSHVVSVEEKP